MRIENRTPWRTDHLRHFAREIGRRELDVGQSSRTTVIFKNTRTDVNVHGCVWMIRSKERRKRGGKVEMFLPKPWSETEHFHQQLAMVLAHEFAHICTGGSGPAWERKFRANPRYGYGYASTGTEGAFVEFYDFALSWPLDPA